MRIAILSDIHDNVWNLETAVDFLADEADEMVCCGDLCSPFIIHLLADEFPGPIHIVFGNNDADLFRITQQSLLFENVHLHGEVFLGEIDGDKFAVNHFPEIAQGLARSGTYDVVCHGHTHGFSVETVGHTLLINPGSIMGYQPATAEDVPATFVIYDTESGEVQGYEVLEGEVVAFG